MIKISWNNLAKLDYYENIDFLLNKWTVKEAQEFIDQVIYTEFVLSRGNIDFQDTDFMGIKCCVICRQITLFYRKTDEQNIEFLRFWNNKKGKRKLKL